MTRNEHDGYDYDPDEPEDPGFRDVGPYAISCLRRSTPQNPRVHPCPTCGEPDTLTPADVRRGYQCDRCADSLESGADLYY